MKHKLLLKLQIKYLILKIKRNIKSLIKNNTTIHSYKKIFPYIRPYWKRAVIAFGLAIPIGSLDAVIALSLKPYMDIVMVEKNSQAPWYIPVLIVVFTSIQGILNYAATYSNDWVVGKVSANIKKAPGCS